jgi:hypothetical protein
MGWEKQSEEEEHEILSFEQWHKNPGIGIWCMES